MDKRNIIRHKKRPTTLPDCHENQFTEEIEFSYLKQVRNS